MALKVKAKEKKLKFSKNENDTGFWRYVMVLEERGLALGSVGPF